MTLEPDPIDPREPSKGGIRWMISCDAPNCKEHIHVGVPRRGTDPRLSAGLSGWALDRNGMDFCVTHKAWADLLENEQLGLPEN